MSIRPVLPTGTSVGSAGQRPTVVIVGQRQFHITSSSVLSVCTLVSTSWCSCKTIIDTHKNKPTDARKRVPSIAAPGDMCEPWCAAYLVGRTLLLVLAVWLGLGGEFAHTTKFPLHYASVSGGGQTCDQSLPQNVWGARIGPRSDTVEGNALAAGQDDSCRRSKHAQDLLHFKELKMNRPVGKVYLAGRLGAVGTVSPRSNSL